MIVQCPSCASRYRVNDANVPASGGKITCPSCQHKFIVYPEEQNPAAGGAPSNDLEDKTSVAFRPDLNKLVDQMQQGGAGQGRAAQEGAAATEVMSGNQIPDFLNGQDIPDDGTVEMKNPFGDGGFLPGMDSMPQAQAEDGAATEVVSGEMLDDFDFDSPSAPSANRRQVQQQQAAPAQAPRVPSDQVHRPSPPQKPAAPAGPPASDPAPSFEEADGPSGPNSEHDGPWKLKTNFGLTYEFPDTKSLRSWMSNREDLDGHELSGDGETFHSLDAWPQISGATGAGASQQIPSFQQNASPPPQQPPSSQAGASGTGAGASAGSGAAGLPGNALTPSNPPPPKPALPASEGPPGKKIQPNEFRPPSRDGKWNVLLWGIVLILLLVAGGLVVQMFGIYDIKGEALRMAGMSPAQVEEPAEEPAVAQEQVAQPGAEEEQAAADEQVEEGGLDPKIAKEVTRLVTDAERAVENNRLKTAAEKLQNAKLLDPKRVDVYEKLATVYEKMGQDEDAEAARSKAGELRAAAAGEGLAAGEEASKN